MFQKYLIRKRFEKGLKERRNKDIELKRTEIAYERLFGGLKREFEKEQAS